MSIRNDWTWKLREWINDSYWAWGNAWYFRFHEYNENIDRCAFFEELNLGWLQMYSDFYNEDLWNLRGRDQYYSLVLGDDNELDQIYSNTITFEWDENDPVDSVLNTWTEQDFMDAILNYCKEIMSEEEYN